jgi:hypothetical protein
MGIAIGSRSFRYEVPQLQHKLHGGCGSFAFSSEREFITGKNGESRFMRAKILFHHEHITIAT